jgi:hypothetical protein
MTATYTQATLSAKTSRFAERPASRHSLACTQTPGLTSIFFAQIQDFGDFYRPYSNARLRGPRLCNHALVSLSALALGRSLSLKSGHPGTSAILRADMLGLDPLVTHRPLS